MGFQGITTREDVHGVALEWGRYLRAHRHRFPAVNLLFHNLWDGDTGRWPRALALLAVGMAPEVALFHRTWLQLPYELGVIMFILYAPTAVPAKRIAVLKERYGLEEQAIIDGRERVFRALLGEDEDQLLDGVVG